MVMKKKANSKLKTLNGKPAKMVRRPGNSIVAKRMQKWQKAVRAKRK